MGRKVHRVPLHLNSGGIKKLSDSEIALVLRGADDLIMTGGRRLLARILKGSKEKRLLELGLDNSPVYGALRDLSLEEVMARIDWLIIKGYLAIEYDYRLPMLIYTRKGWEIERETYTNEMLAQLDRQIEANDPDASFDWLNEKNREVVLGVLDAIELSSDSKYIPALKRWSRSTFRKVRIRIRAVLGTLNET